MSGKVNGNGANGDLVHANGNGNGNGNGVNPSMVNVDVTIPPKMKDLYANEPPEHMAGTFVDNLGLSSEDLQMLKQQFDAFDADGDGIIDENEFIEVCERVGVSSEDAVQMVKIADTNRDGSIDFSEFLREDLMGMLRNAIEKERKAKATREQEAESRTHVNIQRILSVVRAKIDNSKLAFSFGRYVCFLCIYCAVILLQRAPTDSVFMSSALRNYFIGSQYRIPYGYQLVGWLDVTSLEEFWDWHQLHFLELFYVTRYYNGDFLNEVDQGTLLQHPKLTGGFRMMQRRVKNDTCFQYDQFAKFAPDCYGEIYFEGRVGPADDQPFFGVQTGTRYEYESKVWYDFGYFQNFNDNKTEAVQQMQRLRDDRWINKQTQFYRLDFVAYNPNIGQFAIMELKAEIRPTGMIIPTAEIYTRRYDFYLNQRDWIRLAMEVILVLAWIGYCYGEIVDAIALAHKTGRTFGYFSNPWNIMDLIHFTLFGIILIIWIYITADPTVTNLVINRKSITLDDGQPVDFTTTITAGESYFAINGFNMLVAVIRILKYLRMNAFLGQLTDAFELMREGMVQFAIVFFIVVFVFTAMGTVLFGSRMSRFTNPLQAIDTVLGYTVGFADPYELYEEDPLGSLFFYYPFVFLMSFFVLPLTIAVIMDGYSEMQTMYERAMRSNLHDVVDLMFPDQVYRGVIRSLQFFFPNKQNHYRLKFPPKHEILKLFAELQEHEVISFSELRKKFRDKNITEVMLVGIIEKYNAFQSDPDWHILLNKNRKEMPIEDELRLMQQEKDDNDPDVLGEIIEELHQRTEQILEDQTIMMKKLDMLSEIFPTTAAM